jgi:hypothetical protein
MKGRVRASLLLAVAALLAGSPSSSAQWGEKRREVNREIREGAREVARERREARREFMEADTPWERRQAVREGMREVARERREARREIRREIRERW